MSKARVLTVLSLFMMAAPCIAAETVTYQYDAKGRIISVVRSGTVNNGVTTSYTHDKADNRQRVVVSGSSH